MKGQLIEVKEFLEISGNIFATGEINGIYKNQNIFEQALVVDTEQGLTVITGCAHPGIYEILDVVRRHLDQRQIHTVFGGFHLMNKQPNNIDFLIAGFQKMGILRVGPTHCSCQEAEKRFKEVYPDHFIEMKISDTIKI